MTKMTWRRLGLGFALVSGALAVPGAPAFAGDDEECYYTNVGAWEVWYDSLCTKEINRRIYAADKALGVAFTFPADTTRGPNAFFLMNISSQEGLAAITANASILAGGRMLTPDGAAFNRTYSETKARAIFEALRRGENVVITVTYNSGGPHSFTLVSTDFDAAYRRLQL